VTSASSAKWPNLRDLLAARGRQATCFHGETMRPGSVGVLLVVMVGSACTALVSACAEETPDTPTSTPSPAPTGAPPTADAGGADGSSGSEPPPSFTPPPECTSFTYSEWSICHYNSTQTRTVVAGFPEGCFAGGPQLRQPCTFTPPTDGPGLYVAYCADCHGNAKKGKSAAAIQNAINGNAGGMSVISDLTPAQVALIAAAP
jgi:hypothetical protein